MDAEVEALEAELKRERLKHAGRRAVDDTAFLRQFLIAEYQTLDEIVGSIVDSGALEWIIDGRVETKLYYLSVRDRVEYQPEKGRKLEAE